MAEVGMRDGDPMGMYCTDVHRSRTRDETPILLCALQPPPSNRGHAIDALAQESQVSSTGAGRERPAPI